MSDDELLAIFRAEVEEQLAELDRYLAATPAEWDADTIYRIAHNIKGAARMVGANSMREVAHALEDVLADWRAGAELDDTRIAAIRDGVEALRVCYHEHAGAAASNAGSDSWDDATTLRIRTERLDRLLGLAAGAAELEHGLEALRRDIDALVQEWEQWRRFRTANERDSTIDGLNRRFLALRRSLQQQQSQHLQWQAQFNEALRRLRMIRIGSLAAVWRRVLHEATEVAGVEAELVIEGDGIEVDRAVLEGVRDPLNHLLRNAVAHGIEPRAERLAAGKPAVGRIVVGAQVRGSWVCISVRDDGRGIDTAALDAGAGAGSWRERIFHSGVSTAGAVDALAGRGVGLDVVRRNVEALGGRVEVETTAGRGTTFRLHVPLTRLLTQGIVGRVADLLLVFPVDYVECVLGFRYEDLQRADGRDMLLVSDTPVPVTDVATVLGLAGESAGKVAAVIVRDGERRAAAVVEEIMGDRAFAVQPLPLQVRGLPALSGTTIVGHESIAYVVDVPALIATDARVATLRQQRRHEAKLRVLVVDDSVTSRTLERSILTAAGYQVDVATDGAEAWRMLSTAAVQVDAVVTDVEMPHMNGLELTRRIRAHDTLSRLPVVLVTSLGDEKERQAGAAAGADAYVVKGEFDQDQLLATLQRLI